MKIQELKRLIEEFGADDFKEMIYDEGGSHEDEARFKEVVGEKIKVLDSERTEGSGDYDGYAWRFKVGNQTYEISGWYSSYDGPEMDSSVMDFYEVKEAKKTISVYEKVKED